MITNNSVEGRGGGIFSGESSPILINNIITANHAYGYIGIFSGPGTGGGISCELSSLMIINNTISDNYAHGIVFPWTMPGEGGAIECGNSSVTLVNTILWSDTPNEIQFYGATVQITYCDIQGGWTGAGNIDADPCFVDPCSGDYHLKSQAGRWYPNSESWVKDSVTSLAIDAGNPGCPLGDELNDANNVRINMGAYGGTAEASKTPANWRSIADLTNDWSVDYNDLSIFVDYWLEAGQCIPSDLDRSESVNLEDFSIFAGEWPGMSLTEPGMTYQIGGCSSQALGLSTAGLSEQARFTVTVDGQYIHFEDTMVANCCPEELGLEMTVEGELITIYETELTTMPCGCICDYPVSATLGPFEPGTYTLEVYEDWGGFIGSTAVTIN
ncbi:MAG: hypothetical protein ACYS9T_00625 [Planctomycetota bacterium]